MVVHNPVNTAISFGLLVAIVGGAFFYVDATDTEDPYLGIRQGVEVTPALAQAIGMRETRGILILAIDEGSPADLAGLRGADRAGTVNGQRIPLGGDVLVAIDGDQITGADDAGALLAEKAIGDNVRLTVIRGNATQDFNVVIGGR